MNGNKKEEIPHLLYLNIHSKLKDIAIKKYKEPIMSITEMEWRMFSWKVPAQLRYLVIREMIILNLVKKISKYEIQFLDSNFDETDLRKIYEQIGFVTD